ncbi:MAG: DNA mismatch repair endonuclease MutL [Clostridiales bacterium]|nr:DNA mismatch repair endonuclease MutL [Clostridiales bacterium]
MAKINVLPKHIAALIAAGEVVERPSSVIKELLENSIDAGATNISVEIKNGGIRYMRITDNGCGISRDDIRSAFISHATSKIKIEEDLDRIMTLGFRGEALASVAAVSHVEVLTKTSDEKIGTRYTISGGAEEDLDDAGCPDGTTMIIRDLFYNTPARMKFLKKDNTEGNYVSDTVGKIALSHPEISFTLIKDNRRTLFTPGDGRLMTVINQVYGREFGSGLIECKGEAEGISVDGYISKPVNSRPNRTMQHCFVNGRYVKIPVAASALDNAYKNQIMTGKYPSCVLFLTVNPMLVDVNVHPAKTQVRFSSEKPVYDAVYFSSVSALRERDTQVVAKIQPKNTIGFSYPKTESSRTEAKPADAERVALSIGGESDLKKETPPPIDSMYKNVKPAFNTGESPFVVVRQPDEPFYRYESDDGADALNMRPSKSADTDNSAEKQPQTNLQREELDCEPFKIVGEAFETYIIAEQKGKLLFVDKHAAHERIIFNSLKNQKKQIYSQVLLSPVNVTLTGKDYNSVINNLDIFSKSGFVIEDFGEGTVRVRECPTELSDGDVGEIVLEMADQLSKNSQNPESEKLDWLYHSTACRAAVKAGDKISETEMESLVKTVLTDDEVRYCPHGRPVLFVMTEYDIKKLFGRNG